MIRPQSLSSCTNSPYPALEPGALLRNTVFEENEWKEAFVPKEKKCGGSAFFATNLTYKVTFNHPDMGRGSRDPKAQL